MDKKNLYTSKECHVLEVIRHQVAFEWEKQEKRTSWSQVEYTDEVARRYAKEKVEEWAERYGTFIYKACVIVGAIGMIVGGLATFFLK